MLKSFFARLKQGFRTGKFPPAQPNLPPDFRGRPEIDDDISPEEFAQAQKACPVKQALFCDFEGAKLDLGRCIFCGRCADVCDKIRFTKEYRMAVFSRSDLIVKAGEHNYRPPRQTNPEALALRHSCQLREVSAGGCGACELDANVLGTLAWDMGRFGLRFVASPRHADVLYLTGPVSKNMSLALKKTFDAMPQPKFLIAAGACAISGGLFNHGSLPETPALYIPGCPPHPATTLEGLLRFIGRGA